MNYFYPKMDTDRVVKKKLSHRHVYVHALWYFAGVYHPHTEGSLCPPNDWAVLQVHVVCTVSYVTQSLKHYLKLQIAIKA